MNLDGKRVAFHLASPRGYEIWVMDSDGRHPKRLTRGLNNKGADHPRWLPSIV